MTNKKMMSADNAKKLEYKQTEITEIIDEFLKLAIHELKAGKKVNLNKIGVLEIIEKPEKQCYNPHKKAMITIPSRKILDFRPSKHMKDTI